MPTILDTIVATKRDEIAHAKEQRPESLLRDSLDAAPQARDFFGALASGGTIKLIAEVKKASPSKGLIREDFDPVNIAKTYEAYGASCISVLTDEKYFQGHLDYLQSIRKAVSLPVLRKDFILDPYQLLEARIAGADAVLLIAECLNDKELELLHKETLGLGMTPLVEIYEPTNLRRVLDVGAKLIGVNNRDLRTFEVDLQHSIRMRHQIPAGCLLVGESGINSRADAMLLEESGVDAMLVGEFLMSQPDIGAAIRTLLGRG